MSLLSLMFRALVSFHHCAAPACWCTHALRTAVLAACPGLLLAAPLQLPGPVCHRVFCASVPVWQPAGTLNMTRRRHGHNKENTAAVAGRCRTRSGRVYREPPAGSPATVASPVCSVTSPVHTTSNAVHCSSAAVSLLSPVKRWQRFPAPAPAAVPCPALSRPRPHQVVECDSTSGERARLSANTNPFSPPARTRHSSQGSVAS